MGFLRNRTILLSENGYDSKVSMYDNTPKFKKAKYNFFCLELLLITFAKTYHKTDEGKIVLCTSKKKLHPKYP